MKLNLVLELPGKIKIYSHPLNWVLDYGNKNNRSYYSTLDNLCDDLLEVRLKTETTKEERIKDDIRSLREAIRGAREATRDDIDRLKKEVLDADRPREKGVFKGGIDG